MGSSHARDQTYVPCTGRQTLCHWAAREAQAGFANSPLSRDSFLFFNWSLITLQCCSGFCHTLTWISSGCTCVPHPEPSSYLLPHPTPQGHPSAPVLSTLSQASNLDWRSISHMIIYMFQCKSLKSSHPHLLPQSPKVCDQFLCISFTINLN